MRECDLSFHQCYQNTVRTAKHEEEDVCHKRRETEAGKESKEGRKSCKG